MQKTNNFIHSLYLALIFLLPFVFVIPIESSFIVPKYLVLVLGAMLVAISFIIWMLKKSTFSIIIRREVIYLLAFTVIIFISIFYSSDIANGFKKFLPFFATFLFFIIFNIFYANEDKSNIKQFELIQAIVVAALVEAFIVLFQFLGLGLSFFTGLVGKWKVLGTFGNPNYVAEFLLPAVFLAINLIQKSTKPLTKTFYKFSFSLISLAIFATFSRTGLLLYFAGLLFYLFLYSKKNIKETKYNLKKIVYKNRRIIVAIFIGMLFVLLIFPILSMDRVVFKHMVNSDSVVGRVFIWKNSLFAGFKNLPFGSGIGDFGIEYAKEQFNHFSDGNLNFVNNAWIIAHAHNDILQFFVEVGIGIIPFLIFLVLIVKKGYKDLKTDNISIGIFVAFITILGSSLANFPLRVPPNLFLFFLLAAFISKHRSLKTDTDLDLDFNVKKKAILIFFIPVFIFIASFPIKYIFANYFVQQGREAVFNDEDKKAMWFYQKAIALDGTTKHGLFEYSQILLNMGEKEKVEILLNKCLNIGYLPDIFKMYAFLSFENNKPDLAFDFLQKRAYTYRKIISYLLDYIETLFEYQKFEKVIEEVRLLNHMIDDIKLDLISKKEILSQANSFCLAAEILKRKTNKVLHFTKRYNSLLLVDNDLFIATDGIGLLKYNIDNNKMIPILKNLFIYSMEKIDNCLWLGTERGIISYNLNTKKIEDLSLNGFSSLRFSSIKKMGSTVWLTAPGVLLQYNLKSKILKRHYSVQEHNVFGLTTSTIINNTIYFGGIGKLVSYVDKIGFNIFKLPTKKINGRTEFHRVNAIRPFGNNLLGLCTDKGLLTFSVKGKKVVKDVDYKKANFIDMALMHDKSVVVLESNGRVKFFDLRTLFSRINKTTLGIASRDYTDTFIGRSYFNLVPDIKKPIFGDKIIIFVTKYKRLRIFAATKDGLLIKRGLRDSGKLVYYKNNNFPDTLVKSLKSDGKYLYIADNNNIYRFNGNKTVRLKFVKNFLKFSQNDNFSFAADNIIYKMNSNGEISPYIRSRNKIKDFAINKNYTAIIMDNKKIVVYFKNKLIKIIDKTHPLSLKISKNKLYVGTQDKGLRIYDLTNNFKLIRTIDRRYGLDSDKISALSLKNDKLFIGTGGGGLFEFQSKSGSLYVINDGESKEFSVSGFNDITNNLMVANNGNSLIFFNKKGGTGLKVPLRKLGPIFINSVVLYKNDLFIAGAGGVFRYKNCSKVVKKYNEYFRKIYE